MKAAVVRAFGEPLVIEERPDPEPGPGQVRIRLEASGLCHTDIHAAHGDWPVSEPALDPRPRGRGARRGARRRRHAPHALGQRVAVPGRLGLRTAHRLSGPGDALRAAGQHRIDGCDGGYAEKMLARADFAQPVPDGISPPTPPRSPAPGSRRTRRSRSPAAAASGTISASADWAIWRSSTRRSPGRRWRRSTSPTQN